VDVLGVLLFAAGAELMYLGAAHVQLRRVGVHPLPPGSRAAVFLQPHNEHVSLVRSRSSKALFKVFGISITGPTG